MKEQQHRPRERGLKGWLNRCKNSDYIPKAEHYVHLTYFALVALSGPYYVAAGACFVLGVTIVILNNGDGGH